MNRSQLLFNMSFLSEKAKSERAKVRIPNSGGYLCPNFVLHGINDTALQKIIQISPQNRRHFQGPDGLLVDNPKNRGGGDIVPLSLS